MKKSHSQLEREIQALTTLNQSIDVLEKAALDEKTIQKIIAAGIFTPEQDRTIANWFAHFLSLKQNLWAILDKAIEETGGVSAIHHDINCEIDDQVWAYFVVGYSAMCSLVRMDNFLIYTFADNTIIQRKLNEGFAEYRIKRKQWTATYRAVTSQTNAYQIIKANRLFKLNNKRIEAAISKLNLKAEFNITLKQLFDDIPDQEKYLNLRWYKCLWAGLNYRYHSLRRRNASFKQQSVHRLLEYGGRVVSEISLPLEKRVSKEIIQELKPTLHPGDILVTRHNGALTNLFLPGFWPHAALYIGSKDNKEKVANFSSNLDLSKWKDNICTFEALKDGVHLRSLEDTLKVDAFVVLRPNLPSEAIYEAISRTLHHAGKSYNFDFDFFRSDQLVCTEVIYRAYQDISGTDFPLKERLGKKSLSAEDLLDFAIDTNWANPIAIYGTQINKQGEHNSAKIISKEAVLPELIKSYR